MGMHLNIYVVSASRERLRKESVLELYQNGREPLMLRLRVIILKEFALVFRVSSS